MVHRGPFLIPCTFPWPSFDRISAYQLHISLGHIAALAQAQLPFNDASSLSSTASILFFASARGTSVVQELRKDLEYSYQSSRVYEYLRVAEHILHLDRVLRVVVVRLDGATKGLQTSTQALS